MSKHNYLERDIIRFWSHVDKSGECWEWKSTLTEYGYGHFNLWRNGKSVNLKAHRVSWELINGSIPTGLFICHRCDNPKCVNPDHLFLGSHKENMADMAKKGRNRNFLPRVKGEDHPLHKLTTDDVNRMIQTYQQGGVSQRVLARLYGVSQALVQKILTGKAWRYR